MRAHTKIICTIGPSVLTYNKILELIKAGMNVARINMSHGSHKEHGKTIALLKKAREETDTPIAIMLDTKGPEVRVGPISGDQIFLEKGQQLSILKQESNKINGAITLNPAHIVDDIPLGAQVLFDDGYVASNSLPSYTIETEIIEETLTGGTASGFLINVVEPKSIEECVEKVENDIGPIETLVFNLGAQVGNKSLSETTYKIFELGWRLATFSLFRTASSVLPKMEKI